MSKGVQGKVLSPAYFVLGENIRKGEAPPPSVDKNTIKRLTIG